jgi:hypothetical protein
MWGLWWTKWHWDRFFSEYFGFSPVNHSTGAPLQGKQKKLIIFITGLHNKPQGCGASVASAAEPFKKQVTSCKVQLQVVPCFQGNQNFITVFTKFRKLSPVHTSLKLCFYISASFWVMTSCSLVNTYQHFGVICCLNLQRRKWSRFKNVGTGLSNYMVLQLKTP